MPRHSTIDYPYSTTPCPFPAVLRTWNQHLHTADLACPLAPLLQSRHSITFKTLFPLSLKRRRIPLLKQLRSPFSVVFFFGKFAFCPAVPRHAVPFTTPVASHHCTVQNCVVFPPLKIHNCTWLTPLKANESTNLDWGIALTHAFQAPQFILYTDAGVFVTMSYTFVRPNAPNINISVATSRSSSRVALFLLLRERSTVLTPRFILQNCTAH